MSKEVATFGTSARVGLRSMAYFVLLPWVLKDFSRATRAGDIAWDFS